MERLEAYRVAKHNSHYGHRDWLAWPAEDGQWHVGREDHTNLTAAVDAQRVHGQKFYSMSNGIAHAIGPKLAELRLANLAFA